MGGTPSMPEAGIGDLFYPDNPKRRARAEQLSVETKMWCARFNEQKQNLDKLEPVLRGRIDAYLKKYGYATLGDLVSKVDNTLKGDALRDWTNLKSSLSQEHWLDNFLLTVSGIVAAGSGVILGALVLFSVVSGPVGWAVFAGVSAAMGVVALFAGILDVINGGKERDKLREAINELYKTRLQAAQTYRKLEVYQNWVIAFSDFFKDEWVELSPDIFEKKFGQGFRNDFYKFDSNTVQQELSQHDRDVGAWTDEDPAVAFAVSAMVRSSLVPMTAAMMVSEDAPVDKSEEEKPIKSVVESDQKANINFFTEGQLNVQVTAGDGLKKDMNLQLEDVLSKTDFVVMDLATSELLGVRASIADQSQPVKTLEDVKFSLTNFTTMEVLHNCTFVKQAMAA